MTYNKHKQIYRHEQKERERGLSRSLIMKCPLADSSVQRQRHHWLMNQVVVGLVAV